MAFPANFTAIDFETANRRRDSACQLAAVVVRDGEIVDEQNWMLRPDPFFFSPGNIRIHGIRPADVESERTFGQAWEDIGEYLTNDCLIAHNAPFDIGVLIGCLQRHEIAVPELHFSCTRLIAKQTWPDRGRYGLKPLATWLGVDFRHHDALEDSRACASILLAAGIAKQAESLEELEAGLRINRGKAGDWGVKQAARKGRGKSGGSKRKPVAKGLPKRTLRRGSARSLALPPMANPFEEPEVTREDSAAYERTAVADANNSGIDWQRVSIRAELIQPLRGKQIVICGRLKVISNQQAIDLTRRSGGVHQEDADESTNCVLIGADGVDQGQVDSLVGDRQVQVLTESEFLGLLGAS